MNQKNKIITIIGSGVWGTALSKLVSRNHHHCRLWSRRSLENLESVIHDADVILSAVSMQGVRPTIEDLQSLEISQKTIFLSATKGLDPITTLTASQIWQSAFPNCSHVVLSGPNLSPEIEQNLPAATVVSSHDTQAAEAIQLIFSSDTFRVYVNSDPLGTELGGTLKNVMAIASGVCDGLNLGTNAKAALLTRALPEMIRVGTSRGAKQETFFGLSGLGDLLATCNSPLSRNYQVGYRLSQGQTLEQIITALKGTAEGINTTEVLLKIAQKQDLYVPITYQVYRLLKGEITPQEAVNNLMKRDLKAEFYE
ncbi:NAD(P)H-dependent glycerol-3-phosphate dehydrogenase [Aphanothece hegewaldii CCALA 016]|uniref:Glycerol-3-phosphate dehydrogenase [NAD(P)+] n=1 Tax=Aphanothece hegewaldii CCALA 016 TaxID=2107694 RepID=A0A2T1LUY4_9CHRO|nr:NAD(P)H-dependent glycerol-3-phosphate dehydrogenase [Aphanothece hegewaldii]PSF35316.1 NAD(P)H-dependent glycerol-3-phosphate dehydrogenase [Aphanothece hegewaldii CCALA 016]